jgi:hypothetical protein
VTPEAQRIAIAEACGWKNHDHPDVMQCKQRWTMQKQWCMDPKGVLRFNHHRPNYLNDLNAMHEAEKTLTYAQGGEMTLWIQRMTCAGYGPQLFATASQRAEAFLRTIGKWEESK